MKRVFVYGTLLRGEPNHHLIQGSRFLGAVRTPPVYTLLNLGPCPAMVPGGTTSVHGEVFEVNEETLRALDALEKHPDWYRREVIVLTGGVVAQAYLMDPKQTSGRPLIRSGDWRNRS